MPVDARFDEHQLTLYAQGLTPSGRYAASKSRWDRLASATVAVADPRPPTVELEASLPSAKVLAPNGTLRTPRDRPNRGGLGGSPLI